MNNRIEQIFKFWVPLFFWVIVISTLSSVPGKRIPKVHIIHFDKVVHLVEYAILGYLTIRAFLNSFRSKKLNSTIIVISAIIIASIYGMADEWHQRFVPDRTCDALDFLFDFSGINIGIYYYLRREDRNARHKTV